MASKTSAIPRRELRKDSATAGPSVSGSGHQSRTASSSAKTRLPIPSPQSTPVTTPKAAPKKHLHSRSVAAPNNKVRRSPQPRSAPSKSKANDKLEAVEVSDQKPSNLLTPTSAKQQSSRRLGPRLSQSLKAPKKEGQIAELSTIVTQPEAPSSPSRSPYLHAHVGDSCIHGALVHQLLCGHKVMTRIPDQCKWNCRRPLPEVIEKYANSKDEDKAFVCAGCVDEYVEKHRQAKRAMFIESAGKIKDQMGSIPEGWKETQLEYWERVWENDMQKERAEVSKLGDVCACFPGEPGALESTLTKSPGKSTSLPMQPNEKSKTEKYLAQKGGFGKS